ncbi:MAG TPA: DoxX family protein [Candidatus Limnocylindria bacterium]|nr:DoxX family protein [Candidatus Limnocylindria bacterium]
MNADLALFVLRVVVGGIVMQHGLLKLGWVGQGGSVKGVSGWFDNIGLRPGRFWALVAIAAEAGGGLLMVLGLGGPIGAAFLAGDMVVVTVIAHMPQGFWTGGGKVGWEFPLPLAAGAFATALLGYGGWSLDSLLFISYSDRLQWTVIAIVAAGVILALGIWMAMAPKKGAA